LAFEVERDAALVAVHRHEERAVAVVEGAAQRACPVALQRLHLDHLGAGVAQLHGAEGGAVALRQVEYQAAAQRSGHRSCLLESYVAIRWVRGGAASWRPWSRRASCRAAAPLPPARRP